MTGIKDFKLDGETYGQLMTILHNLPIDEKWIVNIRPLSEKRSIDANAQIWIWNKQIAEYQGEDIKTVHNRNKRDFGLPILFDSGDEAGTIIQWQLKKIGFWQMTDEQQIKVMACFNVTSLMSTKQCNEYRDNMRNFFIQNGIDLRYINEPPAESING